MQPSPIQCQSTKETKIFKNVPKTGTNFSLACQILFLVPKLDFEVSEKFSQISFQLKKIKSSNRQPNAAESNLMPRQQREQNI